MAWQRRRLSRRPLENLSNEVALAYAELKRNQDSWRAVVPDKHSGERLARDGGSLKAVAVSASVRAPVAKSLFGLQLKP